MPQATWHVSMKLPDKSKTYEWIPETALVRGQGRCSVEGSGKHAGAGLCDEAAARSLSP